MAWDDPVGKAHNPGKDDWTTNKQVQDAWEGYVENRGAKNTQRNLKMYVGVYIRMVDALVTTLGRPDIERFIERISSKCSRLMTSTPPECRGHRFDITACPLILGDRPFTDCAGYKPLDPAGVWSYICALNQFYDWLAIEERVKGNPVTGPMRDFYSKHAAVFAERKRKPRRRVLSLGEVKQLVVGSPIHRATGYMLMTKCLLREHEALKLTWAPEYCNLEEGWLDIPCDDRELGAKRKGNHRVILDDEALPWMRRYRTYWEGRVKRNQDGTPVTNRILVTTFGKAWGKGAIHNLNVALQKDAVGVELMTGKETEREERATTHCFRATGTTAARKLGAGPLDIALMRGGLAGRHRALRQLPRPVA